MSKQIYIDENGNEVLVSGTITNAGNLPLGSDFSDPTSTAGAIANIGKGTYSTTGLTYNNCSLQDGGYYKLGNIVLVNLRIKLTSAFTGGNAVVSGLSVPNSTNNMVTFSTNQTKAGILSTTGQIILVENLAIDTVVMINGIYLTT